jgi:hypothetical protein
MIRLFRRPNVRKVPFLLVGDIPLVMFVTSAPVLKDSELLLEYGNSWYNVRLLPPHCFMYSLL